jgi:hypothetical protein
MKALRGCLLWLALYALVSLALAVVIERRIGERGTALVAGLVAGSIATAALSHLFTLARSVWELRLIRRARDGAEPEDGRLFAAIGPITPEVSEGVLPGTIRCGVQSIRILLEPNVKIAHDVAKAGAEVCAIGRYSVDKRALMLDRNLEKAEGLIGRRINAMGGALMNVTVMMTIVIAAFIAFFAAVPLDFSEDKIADLRPSWMEISAEDWVETHVRTPLLLAGMPMFVRAEPGASLQPGEARGRMRSGEKEVNVTRAAGGWWRDHIAIRFYDGDVPVGGIMVAPPGRLNALTILSDEIDAETGRHAKLAIHPIGTDQVGGRVSLVKKGVPMCRVVFRVQVPPAPAPAPAN